MAATQEDVSIKGLEGWRRGSGERYAYALVKPKQRISCVAKSSRHEVISELEKLRGAHVEVVQLPGGKASHGQVGGAIVKREAVREQECDRGSEARRT